MSHPFSAITARIDRFRAAREDGRARARMRDLTEGRVFTGFRMLPEPWEFGNIDAARAALAGELAIGAYRTPLTALTPWDLALPSGNLTRALHSFAWLDDFAALGGKAARARAQGWVLGWLDRYGDGTGPGWEAGAAGARLRRLLTHYPLLEKGLDPDLGSGLLNALPAHTAALRAFAPEAEGAAAKSAALSGLIHGVICLEGFAPHVSPALLALSHFLTEALGDGGALASRNPEELLSVFQDLLIVRTITRQSQEVQVPGLDEAIARIVPTLRALRHGDGSLARFHGGGAGPEGLLDRALAESRVRSRPGPGPAMGFVRLHGGRVHIIVDCARPPGTSPRGHASTLAFEMSSGRRPILVNCGPALPHAPDWARVPRTTTAHNALALDKTSSSAMPADRAAGHGALDRLQARPSMVSMAEAQDASGMWIQARHDGYLEDYGLVQERRLFVGALGAEVHGEDVLLAPDQKSERRFLARIKGAAKLGVEIAVHFHLHPEVTAELDRDTRTVRLAVPSGEVWTFQQQGGLVDLESSTYLDPLAEGPVPTRQIVLRTRATTANAQLSWSLLRQTTGDRAPRDLAGVPAVTVAAG